MAGQKLFVIREMCNRTNLRKRIRVRVRGRLWDGTNPVVREACNRCSYSSSNRTRPRTRPYSRSEVIHRAGDESIFPAFERERPRIVNNFAASASSGYEFSSSSEKMNSSRLSNLAIALESATNTQD